MRSHFSQRLELRQLLKQRKLNVIYILIMMTNVSTTETEEVECNLHCNHDDVMTQERFLHHWPFVWGIRQNHIPYLLTRDAAVAVEID